jgi:nickel-dependent lactate racemase
VYEKLIRIPFDNTVQNIRIPESRLAGVLEIPVLAERDPKTLFIKALANPVNSVPFSEFVRSGETLLIVVNDATRSTPTACVLDFVRPLIASCSVHFLISTGSHRAPAETELKWIMGSYYESHRNVIQIHDCHRSPLEALGVTRYGSPVSINRQVTRASKILVIGSVEPHYFAGFTGGRKALVPGTAGFAAIEHNHSLVMSGHSQPMKLRGNPVHEDMSEAIRFLKQELFSIQVVTDPRARIRGIYAGDIHDSLEAAAGKAAEVYGVPLDRKADIVIAAAAPPLDCDLYQSQKAMEHARLAVNSGGILILVSACREGIGPDHFVRLLQSDPDPVHVLETIRQGYRLGHHKAYNWINLSKKVRLYGVTKLNPGILRSLYMHPFDTVQGAVNQALQEVSGKVLVIPAASVVVPVLNTQ